MPALFNLKHNPSIFWVLGVGVGRLTLPSLFSEFDLQICTPSLHFPQERQPQENHRINRYKRKTERAQGKRHRSLKVTFPQEPGRAPGNSLLHLYFPNKVEKGFLKNQKAIGSYPFYSVSQTHCPQVFSLAISCLSLGGPTFFPLL